MHAELLIKPCHSVEVEPSTTIIRGIFSTLIIEDGACLDTVANSFWECSQKTCQGV